MFSSFIQWIIHFWLNLTGRRVNFNKRPFLGGPMGEAYEIGESFYKHLADKEGLEIKENDLGGLLNHFNEVVDSENPFYAKLDPEIPEFYEQTSRYWMEVWSKWSSPVSWVAKALIRIISVEMKQLNIPLDSLESSYGMSSSIISLFDRNGYKKYVCWLRKSQKMDKVVYAGFYSSFQIGESPTKHVRVVFPLPKGNVTVILKVLLLEDGSVQLISDSRKFKGSGYFRLHRNKRGIIKARKIPIKETIHVFRDSSGILRTDHSFRWWKTTFLHLHYKITKK